MKRKKDTASVEDTLTKYYKATYANGDEDVFVEKDLESAKRYATGKNSRGRTMEAIKEYEDFVSATTDYQ